ncbi:hypothetical protein [Isobaculum melis]|uniref:Uncharacterized protein n=1 Tax=Isobaculum melis TaxID=142588 RepID=A0A1H9QVK6_9LACT|nr:hypothetical protein [Isobaculum melis]SER64275.1 hypothetical protein SAMN04488559_102302 [Isobaculum melis]
MNTIKARFTQTIYTNPELYLIIDGKPIVQYIDTYVTEGKIPILEKMGSMLGLLPAWSGALNFTADNLFIWQLVDAEETLNVPILVCEDDCDLDCIVILAQIRKTKETVYWDKIGLLKHENASLSDEIKAGILYVEAYTESDWEKYGGTLAWENPQSKVFEQWCAANWTEELLRRRQNYTKPYMQNEENIDWIEQVNWSFDATEYQKAVHVYRKFLPSSS